MNKAIKFLLELQSLEFDETVTPEGENRIAALRAKIPKPVLNHYDRLCDQGKKGVAPLRHQVCTGCHLRVPLGTELDVRGGEEIGMCGSCGRYLYVEEKNSEEPSVAVKPAQKPGRHQLAHA